jgi:hypothetical protein
MKYLLSILVQTIAYGLAAIFFFIVCLWDCKFEPVKGLTRDYLETVSFPIYSLFGYKTKHYPKTPSRF